MADKYDLLGYLTTTAALLDMKGDEKLSSKIKDALQIIFDQSMQITELESELDYYKVLASELRKR